MSLPVSVARLTAAVALLLVLIAGAVPLSGAAAPARLPAAGVEAVPTGTVVEGMLTVQGVYVEDNARAGTFDYLIDIAATAATGDYRYPDPVVDPMTFFVVDATNGAVIDVQSTQAGGVAVLAAQTGAPFYVYEAQDDQVPFGSENITVPDADPDTDPDPFVSMVGITYEAGEPGPVEPSAEPTEFPVSSPRPSGVATGTIVPNAITIQGLVFEDPLRAGEVDYLINVTAALDVGDYRTAYEGEQTYAVVDLATDQMIDSGSTDANGFVSLDAETDAAFYIVELSDTAAIPGTESLFYAFGDPNVYIAVTGIIYAAQLDPDPSPVDPSPSPADPSPLPTADASPVEPSPSPSDTTPVGQTVTVTIAVPVPDGTEVCLDDRCQTLTAGDEVATQATIPAGAVVTFTDVPPGDYTLTISSDGELLYLTRVSVGDGPVAVIVGDDDAVEPAPSASDDVVPSASSTGPDVSSAAPSAVGPGDGMTIPSAAGSRGAAPVISDRDDVSTLPNTGSGATAASGSAAIWLTLAAALAVTLLAVGIARRRHS